MTEHNVFDGEAGVPKNGLTLTEAIELLSKCERRELRDHAFGDREVCWMLQDSEVAEGYFGGGSKDVFIHEEYGGGSFAGDAAKRLSECGASARFERNDETGPDYYGGA